MKKYAQETIKSFPFAILLSIANSVLWITNIDINFHLMKFTIWIY